MTTNILTDEEFTEDPEIHEEVCRKVTSCLPPEEEISDLADLFKVFGDSTRLKILFALFDQAVCVGDLAQSLNMTQSAISHQLKALKQAKLIKSRREGKTIFYSLADEHVYSIIATGRDHIEEED